MIAPVGIAMAAASAPTSAASAEALPGWFGFTPDLALCVAGLALVCIVIRVLPITLLAGRQLPRVVLHWLSFVPVAVLSALLIPDLVLLKGQLFLSLHNVFLVAALPTLIVVWRTGSFFGAMATGMGVVAFCRYMWPVFFGF